LGACTNAALPGYGPHLLQNVMPQVLSLKTLSRSRCTQNRTRRGTPRDCLADKRRSTATIWSDHACLCTQQDCTRHAHQCKPPSRSKPQPLASLAAALRGPAWLPCPHTLPRPRATAQPAAARQSRVSLTQDLQQKATRPAPGSTSRPTPQLTDARSHPGRPGPLEEPGHDATLPAHPHPSLERVPAFHTTAHHVQ